LLVYSNEASGEIMSFKYFDTLSCEVLEPFDESVEFVPDMTVGDVATPFELNKSKALGLEDPLRMDPLALEVFPNPFSDQLYIEYSVAEKTTVHIVVYDMLGKMIEIMDKRTLHPGSYQMEWNAENYRDGMYILKLSSEGTTMIKKIMLIR
jgi:hypothetical protein